MMAYTSARYDDSPHDRFCAHWAVSELRAQDFSFSPSDSQEARIDWLWWSVHIVCSLSVGIPVALADCLRFPSDQSREDYAYETVIRVTYSPTLGLRYAREGVSPAGQPGQDLAVIEKPGADRSPPDEQPWQ